jgi:effector-binding domain-containing protein
VPSYAVRLVQLDSTPLAVVRRTVKASELATVVPECCGRVWTFVRAQNLRGGRNVALYWDGGIRLEVGVELAVAFETDGEVVPSHTPVGQAATVTHFGPYTQLGRAHEAIREWSQAHGYRLVGPSWEVYDHWQDGWNSNPSAIRTDVFYQVATVDPSAG